MKELIAVVAVIILGIAVGGVIVGFSETAGDIGEDVPTIVGTDIKATLEAE